MKPPAIVFDLDGTLLDSAPDICAVANGVLVAEGTMEELRHSELEDVREFLEGVEVRVGVAHGLGNAEKLIRLAKSQERVYHFIEVMTCPGGCIGGGGQPRFTDDDSRRARIEAIYREDEGKQLRKSHDNPQVRQLYEEFLGKPLGEMPHKLLHTKYTDRSLN